MANEFRVKNGLIVDAGGAQIVGGITGSFSGSIFPITDVASFSASFASISASVGGGGSLSNRVGLLEASSASLNAFTSSQITQNSNLATITGSLIVTASNNVISITNLNTTTSSLNVSVTNINSFTGSQITQNSNLATITGSLILSASADRISITNLNTTTASLNTSVTNLNTTTASLNTSVTNLNTFTSSVNTALGISGADVTIKGNLLVQGSQSVINSTTVQIGDNIIELNGSAAANGGLRVKDATGTSVSGSLLWDTANDYWIAGPAGSELKLLRTGGDSVVSGSSQIDVTATTNYSVITGQFSGIATITGSLILSASSDAGKFATLSTYTGSIDSKLSTLGTYTASLETKNTALATITGSLISTASFLETKNTALATITGSLITSASSARTDINNLISRNVYSGSFSGSVTLGGAGNILTSSVASANSLGNNTIISAATSSYNAIYVKYLIQSGSNGRAGQLIGYWNNGSAVYNEYTTTDVGSTTNVAFSVALSTGNVIVQTNIPNTTWTVKTSYDLM